ncbi:MAG: NAD(P)H-hydrate dehydratase [Clostridia bacterium]|nr:NAD(P)H-hydrate dehydratase [Clostridia bacterium]
MADERYLIGESFVRACLPVRDPDGHKGTFGHVLAVCGHDGMAGTAMLSGEAALRCGAGLLTVALPRGIYGIVASRLAEAVYLPLPETADGTLSKEAWPTLKQQLSRTNALLVGCGLGRSPESDAMVLALLRAATCPTVLDADGLNAAAAHIHTVKTGGQPLCLTPHAGEASRLLGWEIEAIQADRLGAARALAERWQAVVVLKGRRTVIAAPNYPTLINPTGCSGMATGGSGDVLAGMIVSLAAQGLPMFEAALTAVYLHGLAGERASARLSEHGMLPSDMLPEIARLFSEYEPKA